MLPFDTPSGAINAGEAKPSDLYAMRGKRLSPAPSTSGVGLELQNHRLFQHTD